MANLNATIKSLVFAAKPDEPWNKIKVTSRTYVAMGILGALLVTVLLYWWVFLMLGLAIGILYLRFKKKRE